MEQLTDWVFTELEEKDSLFGIPSSAFFVPSVDDRFKVEKYGVEMDTPFGVAAGPHTQMAQNIIMSWLVGARFIELKTIQTLDELDVSKPCIDVEDEGYNVEWSQELKVYESLDEYLRAWVLIHALHDKFGWHGDRPGMIFNMSVGYNLEGMLKPNVQWFFETMADASDYLPAFIDVVAERYPRVRNLDIPAKISDSITLSTMHGCPPDEIERISMYLLQDKGLHTSVKCNPTLFGAEGVRKIVNDDLGFEDVPIPDEAFGHDLMYVDAVPMLTNLKAAAVEKDLTFGVKLSNTLEVENWRDEFEPDEMMYMSGRALHAVTVNLAAKIEGDFGDDLLYSFAGGADYLNVPDLLQSGMRTITVCSDLLKTGGYLRLLQYMEQLDIAMDKAEASNLTEFSSNASAHLHGYANEVRKDWRYEKHSFRMDRSKTPRKLGHFDCIEAPCLDECPVDQKVPQYMGAVREGRYLDAVAVTREDNPIPSILGRVCDHLCENTCIRTHLDQPLAIRHIKRFIMDRQEQPVAFVRNPVHQSKIAIIGAGPAGLSAAQELGYAGFPVTIFEAHGYAGGMVGGTIPTYRLPQAQIDQDLAVLADLGVEIRYNQEAGEDFTLSGLRDDGYVATFIAVGAQLAKKLNLPGEEVSGVIDGISFLRSVREGNPMEVGPKVGVIGAGDTAMDCVRSAVRVGSSDVKLIYRRTIDQMPADPEEVDACLEEGIGIVELAKPAALKVEDDSLQALVCTRSEYRGERDASGRKIPFDVEDSEFDIELDTLILAISQHSILDFFEDDTPELTDWGYIAVDPETYESSVSGVYAGGDVAADGPSSIVKAAADGKRVASAIALAFGEQRVMPIEEKRVIDLQNLVVRRARREYRVPISHTALDQRSGFDETVLGYTPEEASAEASRCLDCHDICSLCVGVCPNAALMTYEIDPIRYELPDGTFVADQGPQIAVLTDFCNECGNCVTVCPTSGQPYVDKPRIYLNREEFEAEDDNAFMMFDDSSIEARIGGQTHRLSLNGSVEYTTPDGTAVLDRDTLAPLSNSLGDSSLRPAATMLTVMNGVSGSMPQIPLMPAGEAARTMVGHPGYEE
jgi:putative selenate reductase